MANVRPKDLDPGSPLTSASIPFDSGSEVLRATPAGIVDAAIPLASQAEAEAGSNNTKRVTPLRVSQAISANAAARGLDNLIAAILGIDTNYQGSGDPAILTERTNLAQDAPAAGDDVAQITVLRHAAYTGGAVGATNNALRIITTVEADVTAFEWALLARLDNGADAGENSALYAQGRKLSTGQTWSLTAEAIDETGEANPDGGLVAVEGDVRANGTDDNDTRVAFDAVITRPYTAGAPAGAAMEAGWGFRVQTGGDASATVKIAFGVFDGTTAEFGFDTADANITGDAIRIGTGQTIALDGTSQHRWRYEAAIGLTYSAAGDDKVTLGSAGSIWTKPLTVATLPAGVLGDRAFVTDCNTNTPNASVAGGGSNEVPVYRATSGWKVGG